MTLFWAFLSALYGTVALSMLFGYRPERVTVFCALVVTAIDLAQRALAAIK